MAAVAVQTERRQCIRQRVDRPVNVSPSIGGVGARWRGRLCDVSRHGLMLQVERRFEKNTALSIRIEDDDGDEMFSLFGQVVYVRTEADGCWSIGCRFTKEMNERDFQDVIRG